MPISSRSRPLWSLKAAKPIPKIRIRTPPRLVPIQILAGSFWGVSSTGRRNTPRWSTLTVGAGAISPLRAKTLDTAFVPSSGSGVIRQYWQLFQPSQRVAFSCGMNRVRACPSICMPFQRGGLE